MAKLFTATVPARAEGNEIDYAAHHEALKTLLQRNRVEVKLADKLVYEDGALTDQAEDINETVREALEGLLKRERAIAVAFKRMTVRATDLDKMALDDTIDVNLVFPNKKPKTLEGSVRLKAVGGENTKHRVKRPVEREEVEYSCDLQGLSPSTQLENKILDITESGPDGGHGGLETVHGVNVYHHTIPKANMSFFYTWEGNTLKVYGIGRHIGPDGDNSQYAVEWFNGDRFNYQR